MKIFVVLWLLLSSSLLDAAVVPRQRLSTQMEVELPESIQAYKKRTEEFLKGPFNPNSTIHWIVLLQRNRIIIIDLFTKIEAMLSDFRKEEPRTLYELLLGHVSIPEWFHLFFRATIRHYFNFYMEWDRLDIYGYFAEFPNIAKFYLENKSNF
jgi:hypothetical protein